MIKKLGVFLIALVLIAGCSSKPKELEENGIYSLPKEPTDFIYSQYEKLNEALKGNDDLELVKSVAISFAADFFTLKNKTDENDVGGMTFFPEALKAEIKKYVVYYYYKNYQPLVNQYEADSLPEVIEYSMVDPIATTFEYRDEGKKDAYSIRMNLKYAETKIPQSALKTDIVVTLVKIEDVYRVVEVK